MAKFDPNLDLHRRATKANKHIETHTNVSVSVPLGQGALNWDGLFASLIRDGFDGFFDIEPHTVEDKLDEFYQCALRFYTEHTETETAL